MKQNDTGRYEEFPYISLCGHERNYIRCDDQPIVFTQVIVSDDPDQSDRLSYGGAGDKLTITFEPWKVCMLPWTGRIYHPGPGRAGGVGLIKSSLAIEWSRQFEFGPDGEYTPPTHFTWKGKKYELTNELVDLVNMEQKDNLENR